MRSKQVVLVVANDKGLQIGLQLLGVLGVISAGIVLVIYIVQGSRGDPEVEKFLGSPGIIERFRQVSASSTNGYQGKTDPLVSQAQAFTLYLNPPRAREEITAQIPTVRPATPSPKFALHGTCYYPLRPEASLALVCEPGGGGGTFRWVRQGAELGHFVIEKIERGAIVYRDGERMHEMLVERRLAPVSFVRGSRTEMAQSGSDLLTLDTAEADTNATPDETPPLQPVVSNIKR